MTNEISLQDVANYLDNMDIRICRKEFYIRNGFYDTEYIQSTCEGAAIYEILSTNLNFSTDKWKTFVAHYPMETYMDDLYKAKRQAKSQGKLKVTLSVMVIVMMLISACSSNNKTHVASTPEQTDSVPREIAPASSRTTDALPTSIFDELANNMVFVEADSGSFYICKYETTQKLWRKVMGDNPSEMQGDDLPVENVNWNDCQRFIAKLNELTGKRYRLPTEVEWEYACQGGKYSKGYKYSGSDDLDKVAWYDENSDGKTHPVGQKLPNELGLYDMSGNVWEWCQEMRDGTGVCRGGS